MKSKWTVIQMKYLKYSWITRIQNNTFNDNFLSDQIFFIESQI